MYNPSQRTDLNEVSHASIRFPHMVQHIDHDQNSKKKVPGQTHLFDKAPIGVGATPNLQSIIDIGGQKLVAVEYARPPAFPIIASVFFDKPDYRKQPLNVVFAIPS
jgi:hypothetical protein